jgi:predicted DNA-binding transcriptional regulator AlpA
VSDVAIVAGAAVIGGRTAAELGRVLGDLVHRAEREGRVIAPSIAAAVQALTEAGRTASDQDGFRSASAQPAPMSGTSRTLVTARQAAVLLGLSDRRIRALAQERGFPDPVIATRPRRWNREDIMQLAKERAER